MLNEEIPQEPAMAELPLQAAAELQDSLMVAENDLERLQRLLADATEALRPPPGQGLADTQVALPLAQRLPWSPSADELAAGLNLGMAAAGPLARQGLARVQSESPSFWDAIREEHVLVFQAGESRAVQQPAAKVNSSSVLGPAQPSKASTDSKARMPT